MKQTSRQHAKRLRKIESQKRRGFIPKYKREN